MPCYAACLGVNGTPSSNIEKNVVAKKAGVVVGGEMNSWFGTGAPAAGGDERRMVTLRFRARSKLGGVSIWSVPTAHGNGTCPMLLGGELAKETQANCLAVCIRPLGDTGRWAIPV